MSGCIRLDLEGTAYQRFEDEALLEVTQASDGFIRSKRGGKRVEDLETIFSKDGIKNVLCEGVASNTTQACFSA